MAEPHRICLACSDRPVFASKVEAYMHARSAHPLILDGAHPDELFELRGPYEVEADVTGPFVCLLPACERHSFMKEDGVLTHLFNNHDVFRADAQLGVHYCAERDQARILAARERELDVRVAPFARLC